MLRSLRSSVIGPGSKIRQNSLTLAPSFVQPVAAIRIRQAANAAFRFLDILQYLALPLGPLMILPVLELPAVPERVYQLRDCREDRKQCGQDRLQLIAFR